MGTCNIQPGPALVFKTPFLYDSDRILCCMVPKILFKNIILPVDNNTEN